MIRGFVGSSNREGRTASIVREALLGAQEQGAEVEQVFLGDYDLSGCNDCTGDTKEGDDWGPEDDFPRLSTMLASSDAVVIGSPVYWSDITSCTRALLARTLRIEMGEGPTAGMPVLGMVVAGGSGNGLVEAMKPLYLLFEKLRWRPLDSFPITRFNWDRALAFAHEGGRDLAALEDRRRPVLGTEVSTFYNDLRYRSYDRIDERRLLAEMVVGGLPDIGHHASVASEFRQHMGQINTLFDRHRKVEAVPLIDDLIIRGTEIWEVLHPSSRDLDAKGD
jgi:multimeric flavodoxin WrbA